MLNACFLLRLRLVQELFECECLVGSRALVCPSSSFMWEDIFLFGSPVSRHGDLVASPEKDALEGTRCCGRGEVGCEYGTWLVVGSCSSCIYVFWGRVCGKVRLELSWLFE